MKLDLSKALWRKSSHSGAVNNCVEVAGNLPGSVAVRDSKRPAGPALVVSRTAWHAFTTDIKAGQFDVRLATARPRAAARQAAAREGGRLVLALSHPDT